MATNTEPWGSTPLTTEGLASLDHPLSLRDFNQDAAGRYWRNIRGEKTYYPREWFDAAGTFTGTGTQPGDRAGQDDSNFFHQGTKWNWNEGQWNNPINWANVIGLAAAGGVGAGIAAPAIGGLGGSGAASAAGGGAGAAGGGTAGGVGAAAAGGGAGMGLNYTQLLLGGAGVGANLYGQNKALAANKDALSQQLESTKYATDAQTKSAAESLAFLRQQAGYDASVAEANRFGDYDQWAAKQEQLGSVGSMLGLPSRRIPTYVPLPTYPGGAPTGAPGTAGPGATGAPASAGLPNIQGGDVAAQVADYFKSRGVTPNASTPQYWAQKWQEFGARDPQYFNMRLSQADEFGGGAPAAAVAAPQRRYQTQGQPLGAVGDYFADASAGIGQLQMPTIRPRSYGGAVGSYL